MGAFERPSTANIHIRWLQPLSGAVDEHQRRDHPLRVCRGRQSGREEGTISTAIQVIGYGP